MTTMTSIEKAITSIDYAVNNPNNVRLYHGGTHLLREVIFNNGFKNIEDTIWDCSCFNMVYFYEWEKFAKTECIEDEKFEYIQHAIMQRANEAGQIQEAILKNPGNCTYVLEFVLPSEALDYIEEDDSCENMGDYGAVQMNINIINWFIKYGKCTINVYRYEFFPKMSYFYYCNQINNPLAEEFFTSLPKSEYNVLKTLDSIDTSSIFEELVLEVEPEFDVCYGQLDPKHYCD